MFDEHRRPWGRLFYLLAVVVVGLTALWGKPPPLRSARCDGPIGQLDNDRNLAAGSHSDLHLDAAAVGLPAAVRQLDAAKIFAVHDRLHQVSI
jgi:hypothetical protein